MDQSAYVTFAAYPRPRVVILVKQKLCSCTEVSVNNRRIKTIGGTEQKVRENNRGMRTIDVGEQRIIATGMKIRRWTKKNCAFLHSFLSQKG